MPTDPGGRGPADSASSQSAALHFGRCRWHELRLTAELMPVGPGWRGWCWLALGVAVEGLVSCSDSTTSAPQRSGGGGDVPGGSPGLPDAGAMARLSPDDGWGGGDNHGQAASAEGNGAAGTGVSGGGDASTSSPGGAGDSSQGKSGDGGSFGGGGDQGESAQAGMESGAGGVASHPPGGDACVGCGSSACGATLASCEKNPECSPWLRCIRTCDSPACGRACDASFIDVARVYRRVYACLCGACEASCSVVESCQKECSDDGVLPASSVAPATLAETGLFASAASAAQVASYVHLYQAKFPLWADGAGKDRYIFLPRCASIDSSDMDHWQFPVGTRLWKHFSVEGKRVETRMLHRYGSGNADWLYATYGWDDTQPDDPRATVAVLHGSPNANGTLHDIPDPSACPSCHGKLPDKPLGFSAFQLSHAGEGLNMQRLSDWGMLSVPARSGFPVPGSAVQQAALGYLHGNCGGCHNADGAIPRENPMRLRLLVGQTSYAQTDIVVTTMGVPTVNAYPELHDKPRIDPRAPANSAVYLRMSDRNKFPMPPLATKFADTDTGVAAVAAWIDSL